MRNNNSEDEDDNNSYRDWNHNLTSLQELGEELLSQWEAKNPHSSRHYPPVRWLRENGYSHLRRVLRDDHDMGVEEFFILLTSAGGTEGYEWMINDVATIERLNAFLYEQAEDRRWAGSTKRTYRARLNQVFGRFGVEYGEDNIIGLANDPSVESEVYDAFKRTIRKLREEYTSDDSVHSSMRIAHRFLEWLFRADRIEFDPMEDIEAEFRWDWTSRPTPLIDDQVRKMWDVAKTVEEKMLIIGYCFWGLRTEELAKLHINQINLNGGPEGVPKIEFDERKNDSGSVTIIFGLGVLDDLIDKRRARSSWSGYLYPDEDNEDHKEPRELCDQFKELANRANLTVEGDTPTPKCGRSFYYNLLNEVEVKMLESAGEIAEEQASEDPKTVLDYYFTEENKREYRRVFFRVKARQILPDNANSGSIDTKFSDFE